ncbi:MAG: hypothetical protein H6745_16275 [Deltaproteobacteria bacterium]|nr:hypothetical protein [Deltaproteobacteria bacterium]
MTESNVTTTTNGRARAQHRAMWLLPAVFAGALLAAPAAMAQPASLLTIDSTADTDLRGCTTAPGDCTLRGALLAAESGDTIDFDTTVFPSNATTTIFVTTPLPAIVQGTITIAGPGPQVTISPSPTPDGANPPVHGLIITSSNNYVSGIRISGFPGDGVLIDNAPNNQISESSNCNGFVTVSNGGYGVHITGEDADNTRIVGAYIGQERTGVAAGNALGGVRVDGGADDTYLGTGCHVSIHDNLGPGVVLADAGTSGTYFSDVTVGSSGHGNAGPGILIQGATGTRAGHPFRIFYNGGDGVRVESGTGNRLVYDGFYSTIAFNGGLGINLVAADDPPSGITPNDADDGDTGPNDLLNAPVIAAVEGSGGGNVDITGTTCGSCTVYFYVADDDPDGHGEGANFLTTSYADPTGHFSGSAQLSPGQLVTAVAIDSAGNMSEFSANVEGPRNLVVDLATDDAVGDCTDAGSDCTLRGALMSALPGDTITFDGTVFPSNTDTVIALERPLPPVTQGRLTLRGPGSQRLTIQPSATPDPLDPPMQGLVIDSDQNFVSGMRVRGFAGDGILVLGARNSVSSNDSCDIAVGDNGGYGVRISGEDADENRVTGGWIGRNSNGSAAPNAAGGVLVEGGADTTYFGLGCHLYVGDNQGAGVTLRDAGTTGTYFSDVSLGDSGHGNTGDGLLIEGATGTRMGHPGRIGYNLRDGVRIVSGAGNALVYDGFYSRIANNEGLGINLVAPGDGADGVTPNDLGDGDSGPNGLLNSPVIDSVTGAGGGEFAVRGTSCANCRVFLYQADDDATGHGEGAGFLSVAYADANGNFSANVSLGASQSVTAVAVDSDNNMSEFSLNATTPSSIVVDRADDDDVRDCTSALADCTLRGALAIAGPGDTIAFDNSVFSGGVETRIELNTPLPVLAASTVTIAGPGATRLVIAPSAAPDPADPPIVGLRITGDDNVISGMGIMGFPGDGVVIDNGARNRIGTYNQCGPSDFAVGNNGGYGLRVAGESADGNSVVGGCFGCSASSQAAPNQLGGVLVEDGPDTTYFGLGCHVSIHDNLGPGLTVLGSATTDIYLSDVTVGTSGHGNGGPGVLIDGAVGARMGHPARIFYNGDEGVRVVSGSAIALAYDGFYFTIQANDGLGVNLVKAGEPANTVTLNDADDSDAGPNGLLNYPVVREIAGAGGAGVYRARGLACPSCRVFLMRSTDDPSGYGEGSDFLGVAYADTQGSWTYTFDLGSVPSLTTTITTLAVSPQNNMSEFSKNANVLEFASVTTECGNNVTEPSGVAGVPDEECDDGNTDSGDGCSSTCTIEGCGDGVVQPDLGEQCDGACDDHNDCTIDVNTCVSCQCQLPSTDYEPAGTPCDDGNSNTIGDRCDGAGNCSISCGNGSLDPGEACDDGDAANGDGCDDDCQVEPNFSCAGTPSVCTSVTDLGVVSVASNPSRPYPGTQATIAVTVRNHGTSLATDVTVTLRFPADLTFVATSGCTLSSPGVVACTVASIQGGLQAIVSPKFNVSAAATGDLEMIASVNGAVVDENDANDSLTALLPVARCGDGVLDSAEGCDDGPANSDTAPGACRTSCEPAGCGDGVGDPGEACDDGNTDSGDGCDATCTAVDPGWSCPPAGGACDCADGFYGAGCALACPSDPGGLCGGHGACDSGLAGSGACSCDAGWYVDAAGTLSSGAGACAFTRCGDGAAVGPEQCDDGNDVLTDSCPSGPGGTCLDATCGDGFIEDGVESCDDGAANSDTLPNRCRASCALPGCGDGVTDSGTYTYRAPGAGSDTTLTLTETCDDADGDDTDECVSSTCQTARCGDGVAWVGHEGCDDGDGDNSDNCPDGPGGTCQMAACGDGFVNAVHGSLYEACDDATPGVPMTPQDGDGCTSLCALEPGYTCASEASAAGLSHTTCAATCATLDDFAFDAYHWYAEPADVFARGATSAGVVGFETFAGASLPLGHTQGAIWSSVAFPALADARTPTLRVAYSLDVEPSPTNCLNVYVGDPPNLPTGAPVASVCGVATASGNLDVDAAAWAGTNKIVAVELDTTTTGGGHFGLVVKAVHVFGDADDDASFTEATGFDFASLACGDTCVDADADTYCDATSRGTPAELDCDDDNGGANPGADEICDNGFDDDCDTKVDAADARCVEDCANGVDDGGNGLVDCEDPYCLGTAAGRPTVDPFCAAKCYYHYAFTTGPADFAPLDNDPGAGGVQTIWTYDAGAAAWTTAGLTPTAQRQFGRLRFVVPLGGRAAAGPKPTLEIRFDHRGVAPNVFAACIDTPTCQGNDIGVSPDVKLLANAPTSGFQTRTVDLTPYLDRDEIEVVLLFDTLTASTPLDGVVVSDVTIASNVDEDAVYEGTDRYTTDDPNTPVDEARAVCDPCWDVDNDFYGDPDSPDLTQCFAFGGDPANPIADCNDTLFAVTPANTSETNCGDGLDNDCDSLTDALDEADCGAEDCANGVDDNGDGNADCADPTCANAFACDPCFKNLAFDFTKGTPSTSTTSGASGGWVATGRNGSTTAATVWQWGAGSSTAGAGSDAGWETRFSQNVTAAGSNRIRGWLTRTVTVPSTLPTPEIEIAYRLNGDGAKDTLGVCFNVSATACVAGSANVAWSTTTNTPGTGTVTRLANRTWFDGTFDRAVVAIPRNAVDIVIFYDTQDDQANAFPGAFVGEVLVRSDIDRDRLGCSPTDRAAGLCGAENFGQSACDVCIDRDRDGRGDPNVSVADLSVCPTPDTVDCDDENPLAYVRPGGERAPVPGHPGEDLCYYVDPAGPAVDADNDCDGKVDGEDPDCIECGNGFVEPGETCDDGARVGGDGCSADCQVEGGRLYVSELHLPVLFSSSAEQWVELYNNSDIDIDVQTIGLSFATSAGGTVTFDPTAPTCFPTTSVMIPARGYYVVTFGAPSGADFDDESLIDGYCPGFSMSLGSDVLTITKQGTTAEERAVDTVDTSAWACLTGNARIIGTDSLSYGRSLMLRNAEAASDVANDAQGAWCLAGPTQTYSRTQRHVGSPKAVGGGGCAEFLCDAQDDDCDGTTDEVSELPNADGDSVCDAQDCEPLVAGCDFPKTDARCSLDVDMDGYIDCRDGCIDVDIDGYGATNAAAVGPACASPLSPVRPGCVTPACTSTEPAACEGNALSYPGNSEVVGGNTDRCRNGVDDDCSGAADCLDAACQAEALCAGEVCAKATPLSCGDTVTVTPVSNDFPACIAGLPSTGSDKVYAFTPTFTGDAEVRLTNLGTRLFALLASESACHEAAPDACEDFTERTETACLAGGRLPLTVESGKTYYVLAKQVGTCAQGAGTSARVVLACAEVCDGAGVDEDADGLADCADADCARAASCATADFDHDEVSNGDEITCGTDPLVPSESPTQDAFLDPDHDGMLNCVDEDDDNDHASDDAEAACASPQSKNDPAQHPALDLCDPPATAPCGDPAEPVCDIANVDADCNGRADTTQIECGVREADCQNGLDDDSDGTIDCGIGTTVPPDKDCVTSTFCRTFDFDGDGFTNQVEAFCNTDPLVVGSYPDPPVLAEDPDDDGLPNCFDDDDDADGFKDNEEIICGSNPLDAASQPLNSDSDAQCDAVDPDDDDDGFPDVNEEACLSDTTDPASTPLDATHDIDRDGTCNALDPDDDEDGWLDFEEVACETDPNDASDNPTANGQDLDGDHVCDKLDADDDDDTWSDLDEIACGTDPRDQDSFPADTDGDRKCDTIDTDDDGDGVDDATEILCETDPLDAASKPLEIDAIDTDHDGFANCVDDDDDDDGLTDAIEAMLGSDRLRKDTDQDGVEDGDEDRNANGVVDADETSPIKKDTDGDGLTDGVEFTSCYPVDGDGPCQPSLGWNRDSDGDGLLDSFEDKDKDGRTGAGETSPMRYDSDGDGFSDGEEVGCASNPLVATSVPVDKDDSGVCDGAEPDTDHDGVADGVEIYCFTDAFDANDTPLLSELEDTDDDGELDCHDLDDDDDDVSDVDEVACGRDPLDGADTPTMDDIADYDGDLVLNCRDLDDDNDGLSDVDEATHQTDRLDRDSDDDGLTDGFEVNTFGTDPAKWDTDGDGISDGTEFGAVIKDKDTADALWQPDLDPSTTTLATNADSDGDGLTDGEEDANHNGRVDPGEGDPNDPSDGLLDTDGDQLIDRDEIQIWMTDPLNPDTDGDGLNDKLEVSVYFTDPNVADSDGGGVIDGFEIDNGTDPNDATDDFSKAVVEGKNVFSCSGGSGAAATTLALLLALGWLVSRRRRRGDLG